MTQLRLVDGVVELDGRPVARLLPGLQLSLQDKLTEAFDEAAEDVALLEDRVAQLQTRPAPEGSKP